MDCNSQLDFQAIIVYGLLFLCVFSSAMSYDSYWQEFSVLHCITFLTNNTNIQTVAFRSVIVICMSCKRFGIKFLPGVRM